MGNILGIGRGKRSAKQALTGYNYLRNNPLFNQAQGVGGQALTGQAALLGLGGDSGAQQTALQNFLNTPGLALQRQTALDGVTNSAAAGGKLESGATLKALQDRGDAVASMQINNYLGQLGNLAGQGLNAAGNVGQAGTSGGGNAAAAQPQNTGILGRFFGI